MIESSDQFSVVLEQSFDVPIASIWEMWTDPNKFASWYGPDGATIPIAQFDLQPGGLRLVNMIMPSSGEDTQIWFTGEFTVVEEPNRLAYTDAMCNAEGKILSADDMGMPSGTPTTTEVIVELNEQDGKTNLTLTHVGIPAGSPGEMGWKMALDKLAAKLA